MDTNTQNVLDQPNPPIELRQKLLDGSNEILVLPQVACEALELAKDPDCSIKDFAALILRDTKLATEILSLSNSTMFSAGATVATLDQAVVRLGLRQCRNLILASSMASMMKSLTMEETWIREVFTRHGFITASACVKLNRHFRIGFQGEEFTAGLLHDLGRSLLAVVSGRKFVQADPLEFVEDESMLKREREILGSDHCEFGAWFAYHNRLPESLMAAIRWHHQPRFVQPDQKLVALTAAGDHIANHLQRYDNAEGYQPEENEGIEVLDELVGRKIHEQFQENALEFVDEVAKSIQSDATAV